MLNFKKIIITLINIFIIMSIQAEINPTAEEYITKILNKKTPYEVEILGSKFVIENNKCYPPGKLTIMFLNYLIENNLLKDKTIIDAGAGSFALGIISAKNGAQKIIGLDISKECIKAAKKNIFNNGVKDKTKILYSDGLGSLLPKYKGKIDLLLAGTPWDTISAKKFEQIPASRKSLSLEFYDIEDKLIKSVMLDGPKLLSPQGKIFITASQRIMERVKKLCTYYKMNYQIVKEEDIHQDGNIHYILHLTPILDY